MACSTLSKSVQATCAGVKKVGGLDKRIYLGSVYDLSAVTLGTGNILTSLTFKATKGLTRWIGRKDKNNAGVDIEVGENLTLRNQTVNLVAYYEDAADLDALEELIDQDGGVFAIVETNSGQLEVYGINKINFNNFGLRVTAAPRNTGTVMQDSQAFNIALTGPMTNLHLLYNPSAELSASLTALDTLSIDPDPVEE